MQDLALEPTHVLSAQAGPCSRMQHELRQALRRAPRAAAAQSPCQPTAPARPQPAFLSSPHSKASRDA